jgi:hypothetical protein
MRACPWSENGGIQLRPRAPQTSEFYLARRLVIFLILKAHMARENKPAHQFGEK